MHITTRGRRVCGATLASISLFALTACGGSGEAASSGEVASLETDSDAASDAVDPAADTLAVDEVALEFSQCLRDQGLDVADIGVDADGNIDVRSALQNVEPGTEGFREAMDACRDILEGVGFGGGRRAAGDNTEMADAMLEFSDCIRSEGFEDIADLTLVRPGEGEEARADGPPEGGRGNREGGFGDRSTVFADRMGLDPEDPAVVAAMDACMPIVDQAFADAGIGEPGEG